MMKVENTPMRESYESYGMITITTIINDDDGSPPSAATTAPFATPIVFMDSQHLRVS